MIIEKFMKLALDKKFDLLLFINNYLILLSIH